MTEEKQPEKEESCYLRLKKNGDNGIHTESVGECNFTPEALEKLVKIDPNIAKQALIAQYSEQLRTDPKLAEDLVKYPNHYLLVNPQTGKVTKVMPIEEEPEKLEM